MVLRKVSTRSASTREESRDPASHPLGVPRRNASRGGRSPRNDSFKKKEKKMHQTVTDSDSHDTHAYAVALILPFRFLGLFRVVSPYRKVLRSHRR